jgi:hypothetical protein
MYLRTESGTRYRIDWPAATRSRSIVAAILSCGALMILTFRAKSGSVDASRSSSSLVVE